MRVFAIVKRILRQFYRDKRTLGLMLFAPMLVLLLMKLVLHGDNPTLLIGVDHSIPAQVHQLLEKGDARTDAFMKEEALEQLHRSELDAYLIWEDHVPNLYLEGSNMLVNQAVMATLQKVISQASGQSIPLEPEVHFIYGSAEMSLFEQIGPILIGVFIFFFVFIVAGVSFIRERTGGTLERLLASPLKRWELVLGYILGFGIFTTLQAIIISGFAIYVLDLHLAGSFLLVLLITFLLAMTALSLGTFLSAFARNELQMFQFIPLVIVPQIFLCGIFDLSTMPKWLSSISYFLPITYGAEALQDVMIRGRGFEDILFELTVLAGFAVLFAVLNIFALKSYRRL